MNAAVREQVRQRANYCCEYCRLPEAAVSLISFHVEHVVARQHIDDEQVDIDNLALACDRCNAYKGTNLSTIDPQTGKQVDVYHPRRQRWTTHFRFVDLAIVGRTSIGRATVRLLHMNAPGRLNLREEWSKSDADE